MLLCTEDLSDPLSSVLQSHKIHCKSPTGNRFDEPVILRQVRIAVIEMMREL